MKSVKENPYEPPHPDSIENLSRGFGPRKPTPKIVYWLVIVPLVIVPIVAFTAWLLFLAPAIGVFVPAAVVYGVSLPLRLKFDDVVRAIAIAYVLGATTIILALVFSVDETSRIDQRFWGANLALVWGSGGLLGTIAGVSISLLSWKTTRN